MSKWIECIPNFSEGRRPEVIDEIVAAITSVDGAYLLDHEMDADHNRAVVTFVSHPDAVVEAAFRGLAHGISLGRLVAVNHHFGYSHRGEPTVTVARSVTIVSDFNCGQGAVFVYGIGG